MRLEEERDDALQFNELHRLGEKEKKTRKYLGPVCAQFVNKLTKILL